MREEDLVHARSASSDAVDAARRATTVADKLLNEIERITAKRERWRGYAAEMTPQGSIGMNLTIGVMTAEIEAAKRALTSFDAIECIACLKSLEDYDDED